MSYQLFEQGPSAYIPVLLVSLVLTLIAYGAFPLIFAFSRRKIISKRKYTLLCYVVNFLIMLVITASSDSPSSGGAYFIWTWVFSAVGSNKLRNGGLFDDVGPVDYPSPPPPPVRDVSNPTPSVDSNKKDEEPTVEKTLPAIRFCRKCGFELVANSDFCSHCGTSVTKE